MFFLIPLIEIGYFLVATARSVDAAKIGNIILYLGGCYIQLLVLNLIVALCRVKYSKKLLLFSTFLLSSIVYMFLVTNDFHHLFYKNMDIETVNNITHIVKDYGPLHNLFYIMLFVYLILDIVFISYSIHKKKKSSIMTMLYMLIVTVLSLSAFFIGRFITDSIEVMAVVYVIDQIFFLMIEDKIAMYNVDEAVMTALIERKDVAYISFDKKKHFIGCDSVFEEFFPAATKLAVDREITLDEEIFEMLNKWIDEINEKGSGIEHIYKHDNRFFRVKGSNINFQNNGGGFGFYFEDDTEAQILIEELREARENAMAASRAKSEFLAHMSHEIRTPINAVLGFDTVILRESKEENVIGYAQDIQNAGQSLLALINDILDLSKIESGKMEIIESEYDFSSLLNDVINMISVKAEVKNLSVELDVDKNLPSELVGDDIRIRQILINIMNNAVKYTEKGGIKLTVTGKVKDDFATIRFCVKDTGIGIKEEDMHKLFESFERIELKRNRNIEGTGLGMSITTQLLALMNSQLHVSSVYGEGSEFCFDLSQRITNFEPIGDLSMRIAERNKCNSYNAALYAPDVCILLVDDNSINRKVFINLLKQTGMTIDEASSGYECIDMAMQKKYDVIFLDHMMPELDGCETLHVLQAKNKNPNKDTPVIVLTANAISGAKEQYMTEGFTDYLSKPVDPDELEEMLVKYIPKNLLQEATNDIKEMDVSMDLSGFPEIDGVDWETALDKLGNKDILRSAAEAFANSAKTENEKLAKAYNNLVEADEKDMKNCFKNYRVQIHSMKTVAATIGAIALSEAAKFLEYEAQSERMKQIVEMTSHFINRWNDLAAKMNEFLPNNNKNKKPDYIEIEKILDNVLELNDGYDIGGLDDMANELHQYSFTDEEQYFVDNIIMSINNIQYDDITENVKSLQDIISNKEV